MSEWETKTINYSMPTDPLELMVLSSFQKLDQTPEGSESVLEQLFNTIRQVEFYTIFTRRTIEYIEESLISNVSMLSIMLELNMYISAELERDSDLLKDLENLIHGLVNAVNVKNYSNSILSGSEAFLSQVYNDDPDLISKVINTWYKLAILIHVYFNSISQFLLVTDRG